MLGRVGDNEHHGKYGKEMESCATRRAALAHGPNPPHSRGEQNETSFYENVMNSEVARCPPTANKNLVHVPVSVSGLQHNSITGNENWLFYFSSVLSSASRLKLPSDCCYNLRPQNYKQQNK